MNMWTKTYFCHQVGNKEYFQFRFSFESHFISQSVDDTNCLCHSLQSENRVLLVLMQSAKDDIRYDHFFNRKKTVFPQFKSFCVSQKKQQALKKATFTSLHTHDFLKNPYP